MDEAGNCPRHTSMESYKEEAKIAHCHLRHSYMYDKAIAG